MAVHSKSRRRKRKVGMGMLGIVVLSISLLFVVHLISDSFVMTWYLLQDQDGVERELDLRVSDDFNWYDGDLPGYSTGNPYNPNADGSFGYVVKSQSDIDAMIANMTYEELQAEQAWQRSVIYQMDQLGYVPNAVIGYLSYIMAEGAAMGTFTYESYYCCKGPSGVKYDTLRDNAAWVAWMKAPNGAGFKRAHELYVQMNSSRYAAIGLGLIQYSDVWNAIDNQVAANATALINAANAASASWQDPVFQINYSLQDMENSPNVRWDLDQNPGPDPKSSTNISAWEWCARVTCGRGMPSWSYTNSTRQNSDYFKDHVKYVSKATDLYNKYSGTDPWYYTKFEEGSSGVAGSEDESTLTKADLQWQNPFRGKVYDNTTPQGRLVARMALVLCTNEKVQYDGAPKNNAQTIDDNNLKSTPMLQIYRYAKVVADTATPYNYWASCDRGVATAVKLAGLDENFSMGNVTNQYQYMSSSSRWKDLGLVSEMKDSLQPGDILLKHNGTKYSHIMMWVGVNIAGEKFPGTTKNLYEASYYNYYPGLDCEGYDDIKNFRVFRCVDPQYSSKYYDKFISEYGSKFPELPKYYQPRS